MGWAMLNCGNCDSLIEHGDTYCGTCGERVPAGDPEPPASEPAQHAATGWGTGGRAWRADLRVAAKDSAGNGGRHSASHASEQPPATRQAGMPFFAHSLPRAAGPMTDATRYLCTAAYLYPSYASKVIAELIASARAVAPSVGVDLGPIIRHCLHARRMQLARDLLICLLLLIGLLVSAPLTLNVLILGFLCGVLPKINWPGKSFGFKLLTIVVSVMLFSVFMLIVAVLVVFALIASLLSSLLSGLAGPAGATPHASLLHVLGPGLLIVLALVAVQVGYGHLTNRILRLNWAARPAPAAPHDPAVAARLARVEAAQHGNLVIYEGHDPFIGTGTPLRSWSIVVELERAKEPDGRAEGAGRRTAPRHEPPSLDPVRVHQVIRDRMLAMQDESLPERERLAALTLHDHLVAPSSAALGSPLVDPALGIPYSQASPEAIDAFIRHPQAGVRYYQRMSIRDAGQEVWAGPKKVMDGIDQDISTSAYVHVAVEGRMFYLEFVATCMKPVDRLVRLASLAQLTHGILAPVVRNSAATFLSDLCLAPVRACGTIRVMLRERVICRRQLEGHGRWVFVNLGTRFSVREYSAADELGSYIQGLDAEKYTKLTERLVLDTVAAYLTGQGFDVSSFVASASNVFNGCVLVKGGQVNGPITYNNMPGTPQPPQPAPAQTK